MAVMRKVLLIDGPTPGRVVSVGLGLRIMVVDHARNATFGGFHSWAYDIFKIQGRTREFEFGIGSGGVNEIMRALIAHYAIAKGKGYWWRDGDGIAIGGPLDGDAWQGARLGGYEPLMVNAFKLYVPIGRDLDFALEALWQRYARPAPTGEVDNVVKGAVFQDDLVAVADPEFTTRDALDMIAKALGQEWCVGAEREPGDGHRGYASFLAERIRHDFVRKGSLPDLEASLGEAKRLVDQFAGRVKAAAPGIDSDVASKIAPSHEARITLLEREVASLKAQQNSARHIRA